MNRDYDMGVMSCTVIGKNILTVDLGLDAAGRNIYQVAWFNGRRWRYTYYRRCREAYNTYKMILDMIQE